MVLYRDDCQKVTDNQELKYNIRMIGRPRAMIGFTARQHRHYGVESRGFRVFRIVEVDYLWHNDMVKKNINVIVLSRNRNLGNETRLYDLGLFVKECQ